MDLFIFMFVFSNFCAPWPLSLSQKFLPWLHVSSVLRLCVSRVSMTAAKCQSSRAKGQGKEHGNTNLEMLTKKSFTNVTQTASSDLSLKERFADVSVKLGEVDMAKHRLKTKLLPECREVSFVSENHQKMLPCFSCQRILSLTHSSNNSQSLKGTPTWHDWIPSARLQDLGGQVVGHAVKNDFRPTGKQFQMAKYIQNWLLRKQLQITPNYQQKLQRWLCSQKCSKRTSTFTLSKTF